MAKFSDRLKELRAELRLSQDGLASKLKVTRSCIGNYEQGLREPNFEDLETIADFFNVDMRYLMGKTDIRTSHPVYSPEIRDFISRLVNLPSDYQKLVYDALRHAERDYEEDREKRKEA